MTHTVLLDSNSHLNTRIIQGHSAALGDDVSLVPLIPAELSKAAAYYPVVMVKDADTGLFGFHALLGLLEAENLYLENDQWLAEYVPLHIKRQPFSIGMQMTEHQGEQRQNPMINIDMDSPRVSDSEGERLFQEHGGQTEYLQNVNAMLSELLNGTSQSQAVTKMLIQQELIESIQISVTLNNNEKINTEGLYSINQEKLAALSPEQLGQLHKQGLLEILFLMKNSLEHLSTMIGRKNKRL